MRIFHKNSVTTAFVILFAVVAFGLTGLLVAFAASTPSLGEAATFGVLASTYTDTSAATTVTGDVGFTTPPASVIAGAHNNYGSGAPYATAGVDQGSALSALALESCTFDFASGAIDLSTDTTHGSAGVYTPGVYCSDGAMNVGGPLTLSGSGTYIFRAVGALTSTAGAVVTTAGASACDVFWTPSAATTLAANTTFVGNIISNAGITIGANTTLSGRALAFSGTITTDTDTITVPDCTPPVVTGTINVVKTVVNDNGRAKTPTDFSLFVNSTPVVSGVTNTFSAPATYTVSETNDTNYTQTFSGDCPGGIINLTSGDNKFCIVNNNDVAFSSGGGGTTYVPPVPPLIDVVKVPSPLALPAGPGSVLYTYTLRNIGTVPVTSVTMVGDTCSPITLISGDTNSNVSLDVDETWVYTCTTTLLETHTNTVVATGWANGLSATDIASATVVVGVPIVPPLIHITKIPNPLTLLAGGGAVTYTKTVTNPGTVALSNVLVTDDKCSPVSYISGDTNNDLKLDTTETWIYTCQTNLTSTTTNTAVATGEANGLTARDFAIATVVVAPTLFVTPYANEVVPILPNTGLPPKEGSFPWSVAVTSVILAGLVALYIIRKKQTV